MIEPSFPLQGQIPVLIRIALILVRMFASSVRRSKRMLCHLPALLRLDPAVGKQAVKTIVCISAPELSDIKAAIPLTAAPCSLNEANVVVDQNLE